MATTTTDARRLYSEHKDTLRATLLVGLFTAGLAALLRLEQVLVWLYAEYSVELMSVREMNWYLEPALAFIYLTVGAHLLFDLRPAFDRTDPGVTRAVQAAGALYIGGFLFFAVTNPPFSLEELAWRFSSGTELSSLFIPVVVPAAFAVATEQEWRTGLKSAAFLTGVAAIVPNLALYAEGAVSQIDYPSTFYYLTDPLLEVAISLSVGMACGIIVAALVFAAMRGGRFVEARRSAA